MAVVRPDGDIAFVCDFCGARSEAYSSDFYDAWGTAKDQGWECQKVGNSWEHTCPECDFDIDD